MTLSTRSNFPDPDAAYRLLAEAHRGLDETQSATLDAALVLLLANHIGDPHIFSTALDHARTALALPPKPA